MEATGAEGKQQREKHLCHLSANSDSRTGVISEARWSLPKKEPTIYYWHHFEVEESKSWRNCQKLVSGRIVFKPQVFWLEFKCFFPLHHTALNTIHNVGNKRRENSGFKVYTHLKDILAIYPRPNRQSVLAVTNECGRSAPKKRKSRIQICNPETV